MATAEQLRAHCHANFPHHRDSILRLLACARGRAAVAAALHRAGTPVDFATAATSTSLCVTALRSFAKMGTPIRRA